MKSALRSGWGLIRSLAIYRFRPWQTAALARFYSQFIGPGDLAFDIGAHVGNRTLALRQAGARVVAVEPQKLLCAFLQRTLPRDITLLPVALGPEPGEAELAVSRLHPTVSSLAHRYADTVGRSEGFEHVTWDAHQSVQMTTLDELIARYGRPQFAKIDVEGFEAEVLAGLSQPLPFIAFEYLPAALDVAEAAVARLSNLGPYRFNLVQGEERHFTLSRWESDRALLARLAHVASDNRSGDIYAALAEAREPA